MTMALLYFCESDESQRSAARQVGEMGASSLAGE